ncbi:MAG: hypothetical protein ACI3ZQ_01595 [Candidatus Cryptobacteroides sp.]
MLEKRRWFTDYNVAVFTLVFMSVQFMYLEGGAVSIPKVVFMVISPFLLLLMSPNVSRATIFGLLFLLVTVAMSVIQFGTPRMSTFYYTALFLLMFNLYYNLVYINKVFSIDDFLRVVKFVIWAYAVCLVVQQAFFIVGLKYMPIVNLMGMQYYELFRLNSLAIEPSHAARLLTVYFYAFLKLLEYKQGSAPSISYLWQKHRWTIVAFLYTMVGIGSGTAFVGLAILAMYFLKRQYVMYVLLTGFAFYMAVPFIDYEPLNRAMAVFNATLTGDTELVAKTDQSASSRVNIIIDTFKYLDLTDINIWLGRGVDSWAYNGKAVVSAITDYGLISYLLKLLFFFECCFTSFFSLEILMFVLLFSMNVGNIAYGWAALMVFSTIKYFKMNRNEIE